MSLYRNVIAAFALISALSSCKKKDPQPEPVYPATTLSATIDGQTFYAVDVTANQSATSLSVSGLRNGGTSRQTGILINIPRYSGLGTYPVNNETTAAYADIGTTLPATSGTIEITTSNDVHVEGTFSFDVTSNGVTRQIRKGKMNIYK